MKADRILIATMAEPVFPVDPRTDGWSGDTGRWKWFYRVSPPVDATNAKQFPAIAEARRHLASLSAERKQQIEKEWNDGKI